MAGHEQDTESFVDLDVVPAPPGVRPRWWTARVSSAESAKLIRPGVDTIGVVVTLDCAGGGVPDTPLPVTIRVRTPDGRAPEVVSPLTVWGTSWDRHLGGMCQRAPVR